MAAAMARSLEKCEILLEYGADPNLCGWDEVSVIEFAVSSGRSSIVALFRSKKLDDRPNEKHD